MSPQPTPSSTFAQGPFQKDGGTVGSSCRARVRNIFKEGVTSFDVAQNIVVVKTMPGLASAAGAALDGMDIDGFVGSLAGDDTVIIIMRTNHLAEEFCREMAAMLD